MREVFLDDDEIELISRLIKYAESDDIAAVESLSETLGLQFYHRKVLRPAKQGKVSTKMAGEAVQKVLHDKNRSKAEKTKRGSALTQG